MNSARYIFERDFDQELEIERGESPAPERLYTESELQAALDSARETAFSEGQDRGWRTAHGDAVEQAERQHLAALELLSAQLSSLMGAEALHRAKLEREVVSLAHAVLEKVVPNVQAKFAQDRLRSEILSHLHLALGSARLFIKLSVLDTPHLEIMILREAEKLGVGNRIQISSDAALSKGECRVDWDDGFMEFGFDKVCEKILALLQETQEQSDLGKQELKQKHG
ncbi:FliH/SctL family protein [Roseivivax sp. CAU 1753]